MPTDNRLSRMLHVLIHMDRFDAPVTSEVLASMLSTNAVVVRRTMAGLRDDGYVRSEKGHGGGWTLARPLSEITLLDIYTALDAPDLFSIGFSNNHGRCQIESAVNVRIAETLKEAETLLLKRFGEIRLSDIAGDCDQQIATWHAHPPSKAAP